MTDGEGDESGRDEAGREDSLTATDEFVAQSVTDESSVSDASTAVEEESDARGQGTDSEEVADGSEEPLVVLLEAIAPEHVNDGGNVQAGEEVVAKDSIPAAESAAAEIAAADDETLARAFAALEAALDRSQEAVSEQRDRADDLESRLARKQAEFQNYKKRQEERLEEEKARATEDLVERLLDVRDNLERALEQDEDAEIRNGVETTLEQFDSQFEREGVEQISPDPGAAVDPVRHEVLATVDAEERGGTIAELYRPGYEMAGKVLRPAQVTVSEDDTEEITDETTDGTDDGTVGETADASDGAENGLDI